MCLITLRKSLAPFETKDDLENVCKINPDGIGISYILTGELITKKGFENFDSMYEFYQSIPSESPSLFHARKISAGDASVENLHPFIVNQNLVAAFNGTISELVFKDSPRSDTWVLNDIILQKLSALNENFYKDSAIQRLLDSYIKNGKLVFFDNAGEFVIIGEKLGYWNTEGNIWYSNNLCFKKAATSMLPAPDYSKYQGRSRKGFHKKYPNHAGGVTTLTSTKSELKKKYFLVSDKFYQELSLEQINELKCKHHKNTRKLKQAGVIAKLSTLSDAQRFAGWMKKQEIEWEKMKSSQETDGQLLLLRDAVTERPLEKSENNLKNSENILDGCISVVPGIQNPVIRAD